MTSRCKIYIIYVWLLASCVCVYAQQGKNYNQRLLMSLRNYPDSISYNNNNRNYTLWKNLNGQYIAVASNLSLKDIVNIKNTEESTNDLYNQNESLSSLNNDLVPSLQATPALYNRIFNNAYVKPPDIKYDLSTVKQLIASAQNLKQNYQQIKYKFKSSRAHIDSLRKQLASDSLSQAISDSLRQALIDTLYGLIRPLMNLNLKGNILVNMGFLRQSTSNPSIPKSSRVSVSPDFRFDANLNASASIGSKITVPSLGLSTGGIGSTLGSTGSGFGLVAPQFGLGSNAWKLSYQNNGDEILRNIEIFNTSFITPSLLIPSTNSIFGVSARLQFGRLSVSTTLGKQNSQMQTIYIQPGQGTSYSLYADAYDVNRNFLLAQYFYNNFNHSMSRLPAILSNVRILRIEIWVTNRFNQTNGVRQIIGFSDLGEPNPHNPNPNYAGNGTIFPNNQANGLYNTLLQNSALRNGNQASSLLMGMGLRQNVDFEQVYARKLNDNEYYLQPQLGYISLNTQLQSDDILAVAFQYSYNGQIYQVGEFSESVPPDTLNKNDGISKNLYVKLLKGTVANTKIPLWNLMMKNVYVVSAGGMQSNNFTMDISYNEPGKNGSIVLPGNVLSNNSYANKTILQLEHLDTLNAQGNPLPDGVFDYIEGATVISKLGKIIFPVLQPFGRDLAYAVKDTQYLFYPLYDTIQAIAHTYANFNRYVLQGHYQSSTSTPGLIQLGYNISPGSVKVMAGSMLLAEGQDYVVNYSLGTLQLTNPAYLNTQIPLTVVFENNALFGTQTTFFWGTRFDYLFKNKKFKLGLTMTGEKQIPYTQHVLYGQDPTNNQMYGLDLSYMDSYPWITSLLNLYPTIKTKDPSTISVYTEGAMLNPGHPNQIGKGSDGTIYIDDFESTQSILNLNAVSRWFIASTPATGKPDSTSTTTFANLFGIDDNNVLSYGYHRARLAWYIIDPNLQDPTNPENPFYGNYNETTKSDVRAIYQSELFPNASYNVGQNLLPTFDVAYYPYEKGPFNYNANKNQLNSSGYFIDPTKQWGGMMMAFNQTDFQTANIQYIRFWVKDPFENKPNSQGGDVYFQLGDVSEDVMKDGNMFSENQMPTPDKKSPIDSSAWGYYPLNSTRITYAFDNNPNNRKYQDVGLDGLNDDQERSFFSKYLQEIAQNFGTNSPIYNQSYNDPSGDDFRHYLQTNGAPNMGILERYKLWNNTEGNSPIATATNTFAATLYPDAEDINKDNVLNQNEAYYQYKIHLSPNMGIDPNNFVVDKRSITVQAPDGNYTENWYLFQIPVEQYNYNFNMSGFQSIRFMRMFLTGFQDSSIVLRFAQFGVVLNQWRPYNYNVDTIGGSQTPPQNKNTTILNISNVSIQEDDQRSPIPYLMPPGVRRQETAGNGNNVLLQNEHSLSLQVLNLANQDTRGVFKVVNTMDLRNYGRLSMFLHAESPEALNDNNISAVIRLGSDLVNNYYEIRIPLKITQNGATSITDIWPTMNNLDFDLSVLPVLKMARNAKGLASNTYYKETINGRTYAVIGQPNIAQIQTWFLGLENTSGHNLSNATVWFDELRLSNINEQLAWASVAKINFRLADIGNINISGMYKSIGWGTLNDNASERAQNDEWDFAINSTFALDRFFPKQLGIVLPFYISYSKNIQTPKYNPLDPDIRLNTAIAILGLNRDSMYAASRTTQSVFSIALPTIQIFSQLPKIIPVSPSNFTFNYSYTNTIVTSPLIQEDNIKMYIAGMNYQYTLPNFFWTPFKNIKALKSPWWRIIRDFNLRPFPNVFAFGISFQRQFAFNILRNVYHYDDFFIQNFNKYFYINRNYLLSWQLTNALQLQYTGLQRSFVDEPAGFINTPTLKKAFWNTVVTLGRNTFYMHNLSGNYLLPLYKIPIFDILNSRLNATASYQWTASSLLTQNIQGNTIGTSLMWSSNNTLDFQRLYEKNKWLNNLVNTSSDKIRISRDKILKPFMHLLTAIKMIDFTYTETYTNTLPGVTNTMKAFGQIWNFKTPFSLLIGLPTDSNFLNRGAAQGWFTNSPDFNGILEQGYAQTIKASVNIRPIPTLQIQLFATSSFTKNYSEIFKDTLGNGNFTHLNPYNSGSFAISYIALQTMFIPYDPNQPTGLLAHFMNNRVIASQYLGQRNPYSQGQPNIDGYTYGYGKYSPDVLMATFISTYTKTPINKTPLIKRYNTNIRTNPFSAFIPLPNWKLTYAGLSDLLHIPKNIISRIVIQNAYTGSLSMNSFNNNLLYSDPFYRGWPGFIDPNSKNFIPYFLVPNIAITDQFFPLIGTDLSFLKMFTGGFAWNKSRIASLSLVDYQIIHQYSNEFIIRFGWQKLEMKVPFRLPVPRWRALRADLIINVDVSYRDDININTIIDQAVSNVTGGNTILTISPYIDYIIQKQFSMRLYFNLQNTYPKLATTAPSSIMGGGLQIKWTFL